MCYAATDQPTMFVNTAGAWDIATRGLRRRRSFNNPEGCCCGCYDQRVPCPRDHSSHDFTQENFNNNFTDFVDITITATEEYTLQSMDDEDR